MSALSEGGFAVREVVGGVQFALRVQPGAKREGVVGAYGEALKIALNAPAVDGKANEALVRFIAETLHISRASVEIVSGLVSRSKVVRILGVTADEVLVAFSVQRAS